MLNIFFLALFLLPNFSFAEDVEIDSTSKIDREGIRKTFLGNNKEIQTCYNDVLKASSKQKPQGKMVLDVYIGKTGNVVYAGFSKDKSTLYNYDLAGCLQQKIKAWVFPKPPEGQSVQIFYPLAFSPN